MIPCMYHSQCHRADVVSCRTLSYRALRERRILEPLYPKIGDAITAADVVVSSVRAAAEEPGLLMSEYRRGV